MLGGTINTTTGAVNGLYSTIKNTDWLNRSGNNYTHQRSTNRMKWEALLGKGDAYSSFIYRQGRNRNISPDTKILVARQLGLNILHTMNVNKVKLNFQVGKFNRQWGRDSLEVSVEPFDPKNGLPSFNHELDIFLGQVVHEMAHILYTTDAYEKFVEGKPKAEQHLAGNMLNVIEDERIEIKVGEAFPGYANYLSSMKKWLWGGKVVPALEHHTDLLEQLVNCILLFIRYPNALPEEKVIAFEQELTEVREILTPYPNSMQDAIDATEKILALLKKYVEDHPEAQSPQKQPGENGEPEDGEITDEMIAGMLEALMKTLEEADSSILNIKTDDKVVLEKGSSPQQAQKIIKIVNNLSEQQLEELTDDSMEWQEVETLNTSELKSYVVDRTKHRGSDYAYRDSLGRVSSYASSLRANLKMFNRRFSEVIRGLDEGQFDDDMLVDAKLGCQTVYTQNMRIKNNGAVIGLIVDESGSMGGDEIRNARDIAVMFERALDGLLGIDFFCYGHTTGTSPLDPYSSDATILNCYYEGRKRGNRQCLGSLDSHETNRDGHALLLVAGRMRKQTKQPIVLFMISDGMPSASVPHGYTGITFTKKCVEVLKKKDIHVIHIAINNSVKSEKMFTDYVKFDNMKTLTQDIGKLLKKKVEKIQSPEIIYED